MVETEAIRPLSLGPGGSEPACKECNDLGYLSERREALTQTDVEASALGASDWRLVDCDSEACCKRRAIEALSQSQWPAPEKKTRRFKKVRKGV